MSNSKPKANVRTIAQELGIAVSTVSRALNNAPDVSKETSERVLQKCRELGYQPNRAGRRLRRQKGIDIVGYLLTPVEDRFADPMILDTLMGLNEALSSQFIDLTVHLSRSAEDEIRTLKNMVEHNVVDAIVLGRTRTQDERIAYLESIGFRYATLGQTACTHAYRHLDIDNREAARTATELLLNAGYRKLTLITPSAELSYAKMQAEGYRQALQSAGLDRAANIACVNFSSQSAQTIAAALLAKGAADAFVCGNDVFAAGVYSAVENLGLVVGADIGVTGFGANSSGQHLQPALTTFDPPMLAAGRRLAHLLLDSEISSEIWSAELKFGQSHQRA